MRIDHANLLTAGAALDGAAWAEVRRRAIFECCKWDPQVEDVSVLSPFPLLLRRETWVELKALAEALAAETIAAEAELVRRRVLHGRLGLPRAFRRALRGGLDAARGAARVMRFDFHLAREGWRITEVNSDVPGGFIEASGFTRLLAEHFADAEMAADPAEAIADALARAVAGGGGRAAVAMVHATAYTDDRQVMVFLERHLRARGLRTFLVAPDQIRWDDGDAAIETDWHRGPVDAILRFFPAEWLVNLPRGCGWQHFVCGGRTPLCNPATALLTQSKRFPLVWDDLDTPLPTWRRLLPETRDPREVPRGDEAWVLKPALGRVGEDIGIRGVTDPKQSKRIERWARWYPSRWVAQRRFEAVPTPSPMGQMYPCLGIFTIDGEAAGIYGRMSPRPLINHVSRDVAVLLCSGAAAGTNEVGHVLPAVV